jgi:hypothetical protein
MRFLVALACAAGITGCNKESFSRSVHLKSEPDGSSLKTETEESTKNGVETGTKTETRTEPGGKVTVTNFTKKDGRWVQE